MNRAQRRKQERRQAKLAHKPVANLPMKVAQPEKGLMNEQMSKRDYVAYSVAMGITREALLRTKGVGEARMKEIFAHIKAIEGDLNIERHEGDEPDGIFTRELVKEIGIHHMGLARRGGTT